MVDGHENPPSGWCSTVLMRAGHTCEHIRFCDDSATDLRRARQYKNGSGIANFPP